MFFSTFFSQFSPELAIFLSAMLPIIELRGAIPFGIGLWDMNPYSAFGLAVLGNLVPFPFLYFGLRWVQKIFNRYIPCVSRFIDAQIDRAQKRVEEKYHRYGALALFLFTALPLPLTGLWTATLAAIALKIPFRYAAFSIIPGVLIAGVIVSLISVGVL
jgi:uncharacterized membrane protein